jgi:hypothetical protein
MYAWAEDTQEQIDMCVEVQGILDNVDDALMTRVLKRRGWYLVPNASTYPTLQAYIDASYEAMRADVRAYQAEVAAAEAAHRKRRRAELKAERTESISGSSTCRPACAVAGSSGRPRAAEAMGQARASQWRRVNAGERGMRRRGRGKVQGGRLGGEPLAHPGAGLI